MRQLPAPTLSGYASGAAMGHIGAAIWITRHPSVWLRNLGFGKKRFIRIYQQSLASRAGQIEQVDIRYTNGVAVSWRAGAGNNNAG